jgi:hypothetical protein
LVGCTWNLSAVPVSEKNWGKVTCAINRKTALLLAIESAHLTVCLFFFFDKSTKRRPLSEIYSKFYCIGTGFRNLFNILLYRHQLSEIFWTFYSMPTKLLNMLICTFLGFNQYVKFIELIIKKFLVIGLPAVIWNSTNWNI